LGVGTTKFLIVSNGLRDHLGHYFETSVSVAEAARRLGLHPVLATHVECPLALLPNWLESHALFRIDHWGRAPAPREASAAPEPMGLRRACLQGWRWCRRMAWLADRSAYFLLPPAFYDLKRLVAYCCRPRVLKPECRARVSAKVRAWALRRQFGNDAAIVAQARDWPELSQNIAAPSSRKATLDLLRGVVAAGFTQELENALVFQRDLEHTLSAAGVGCGDHVWLGTAHAREILAVRQVVERWGLERSPTFHLEFRHPLFDRVAVDGEPIESENTRIQRLFFSLGADRGASEKIKLYTDAEELSRDYESVAGLPFGVLPLPFRAELISGGPRKPGTPLRVAYLGQARDEKGFPWLPGLVQRLADDYIRPRRASFLIQSNVSQPEFNPQSVQALRQLRSIASEGVELLTPDAPLPPADYYRLVSQADLVLLPYLSERYRACTSGVLAEALAKGVPAVVPAGTWMAHQLPPGGGETFETFESFVTGVRRILDDYDSYRVRTEAHRPSWLKRHTPEALVAHVLEHGN
jgi:glycosyltransferase involved in cell wall biosynthesis